MSLSPPVLFHFACPTLPLALGTGDTPLWEVWVHSQHPDVSQRAKAIPARVESWQSRNLGPCWIINQGSHNSWGKKQW